VRLLDAKWAANEGDAVLAFGQVNSNPENIFLSGPTNSSSRIRPPEFVMMGDPVLENARRPLVPRKLPDGIIEKTTGLMQFT